MHRQTESAMKRPVDWVGPLIESANRRFFFNSVRRPFYEIASPRLRSRLRLKVGSLSAAGAAARSPA